MSGFEVKVNFLNSATIPEGQTDFPLQNSVQLMTTHQDMPSQTNRCFSTCDVMDATPVSTTVRYLVS